MSPVSRWEKVAVGAVAVLVLGCGPAASSPQADAGIHSDGPAADVGADTRREAASDTGAGTSNDAGSLPACMGMTPAAVAGLCVLDPAGARAVNPTPFNQVPVTVVSVGSGLPAAACAGGGPNGLDPNTAVTRIVLRTAAGAEWMVYVLGLGPGVVSPGDALEMWLTTRTVVGWITQELILARGTEGQPAFFAAAMNDVPGGPLMPPQPAGIFFRDPRRDLQGRHRRALRAAPAWHARSTSATMPWDSSSPGRPSRSAVCISRSRCWIRSSTTETATSPRPRSSPATSRREAGYDAPASSSIRAL